MAGYSIRFASGTAGSSCPSPWRAAPGAQRDRHVRLPCSMASGSCPARSARTPRGGAAPAKRVKDRRRECKLRYRESSTQRLSVVDLKATAPCWNREPPTGSRSPGGGPRYDADTRSAATVTTLAAIISRAASVVPLTLLALALALAFVVIVAVVWPTPERRAMVDRLVDAIKELGSVIVGKPADDSGKVTGPRRRKVLSAPR